MIYNKTQKFKVINTKIIYYNEIDVLKHVYRFIIIIKKEFKMWIKLDIINTKSIYYNGINVLKQVYRFIINIQIQKSKMWIKLNIIRINTI